jgi:hypothetical protein
MSPDDEVEFNVHLLNDIDPLTALAALPADPAENLPADPGKPSTAYAWGMLAAVVTVLAVIVYLLSAW